MARSPAQAGNEILDAFPFLSTVPQKARDELLARSARKTLSHKQVLVTGGADCRYLPLVLQGTLRIYKTSEGGKELTLYRIDRGESCVLSATCILNTDTFPAMVEAEGQTEIVLVPSDLLSRWVDEYPEWRRFVFRIYAKRLEMMMTVVEEVAFRHVDDRIAAYLASAAGGKAGIVRGTHQMIASEVGTSREVVSRILRDFEASGLIATERGQIRILQPHGIAERASQSRDS